MKKQTFNILFIVVLTILLVVLSVYKLTEKYINFALLPILTAYYIGQYSERNFK